MKRIAKFHKVSPEQFAKDWKDTFPAADDKEIQDTYEKISLPVRQQPEVQDMISLHLRILY